MIVEFLPPPDLVTPEEYAAFERAQAHRVCGGIHVSPPFTYVRPPEPKPAPPTLTWADRNPLAALYADMMQAHEDYHVLRAHLDHTRARCVAAGQRFNHLREQYLLARKTKEA